MAGPDTDDKPTDNQISTMGAAKSSSWRELKEEDRAGRDIELPSRTRSRDGTDAGAEPGEGEGAALGATAQRRGDMEYRVYRRRWFGLIQLTLLNIIVSWDVSPPCPNIPRRRDAEANHVARPLGSGSPSPPSRTTRRPSSAGTRRPSTG